MAKKETPLLFLLVPLKFPGRLSSARFPRNGWSRYNCCIWSSARGGFTGIAPL